MSPGTRLFRERALKRISSPEQLDRLVQVTSPRRWIGLGALLVVVAGAIVWSAVATVPTTLSGPGFLLPLGGLREVQAPASGIVTQLDLAVGQHIVAGQSVGSLSGAGGASVTVRAPETGVVSESDTVRNAFVQAGDRLGLVEPIGWPLVLYSYVPANVAAGLAPGTPVHVTFGAGIGATYGYAKGHVQSVGQFPVTPERLAFILQDSSVISQVQTLGASNEVVIELDQSARTPSGLEWGSGLGPPSRLPAGLPAKVEFVVGSHHPIDNVL
jgi:hypothetical protein